MLRRVCLAFYYQFLAVGSGVAGSQGVEAQSWCGAFGSNVLSSRR